MSKPLVSDALWTLVAPLLPPEPPKPLGGRPRIANRAALTGILFVLKSGIPWEMLPQEMGCGSGMTCWRRLRDWQRAGVWLRLHHILLQRLQDAGHIDWGRASLDSASVPAPGGEATGKDPTNRGKLGAKRHLVVDRHTLPCGHNMYAQVDYNQIFSGDSYYLVEDLSDGNYWASFNNFAPATNTAEWIDEATTCNGNLDWRMLADFGDVFWTNGLSGTSYSTLQVISYWPRRGFYSSSDKNHSVMTAFAGALNSSGSGFTDVFQANGSSNC